MPAKRLPWFKFWIGATANGKVRQLDDGTFRTWMELLDAAAQQPRRGRFASRREAVSIVRRPAKHVAHLIAIHLIDETPQEITMHDWDEWQRWRKEDANDTPDADEQLLNDSRTTAEHPTHGPPDEPSNDSRTSAERLANVTHPLREKEKREEEIDLTPLKPPEGPARLPVPKPRKDRTPITEDDIEDLVAKYAAGFGGGSAVRDEIDAALNHTARFKALRERIYVDKWLRTELGRPALRIAAGRGAKPEQERRIIDHTGCEAGCIELHPERSA